MKSKPKFINSIKLIIFLLSALLITGRTISSTSNNTARFEIDRLFRARYARYNPRPLFGPAQPAVPRAKPTDALSKPNAHPRKRLRRATGATPIAIGTPTTRVQTEALRKIGASEYHTHGFTGEGVKVAIIDASFGGLTPRIQAGELPLTLIKRQFFTDGGISYKLSMDHDGHGTACAEIIHDIAPQAQPYLIEVESLAGTLHHVLDYLHSEGVYIVSISMSIFPQGPGDGTGYLGHPPRPIYETLRDARENKDMLIIKSAGNYARQHYSGHFRDKDNDGWHEFAETWAGGYDEAIPLHLQANDNVKFYATNYKL